MMLIKSGDKYITIDNVSDHDENHGALETVFVNGHIAKFYKLEEIRERVRGFK